MKSFKTFFEEIRKKKKPGDTQRINSNGAFIYRLPDPKTDAKWYGSDGSIEYIK